MSMMKYNIRCYNHKLFKTKASICCIKANSLASCYMQQKSKRIMGKKLYVHGQW
uniref:Uncharacterized protein n=1 Tax=Rhizophora mucronata TaxID=61149 RepID=A0A2P2IT42_RHIMU